MTGISAIETMRRLSIRFAHEENGATAIEYGLIVSLIFLAILAAVNQFASNTSVMYLEISSNLTSP